LCTIKNRIFEAITIATKETEATDETEKDIRMQLASVTQKGHLLLAKKNLNPYSAFTLTTNWAVQLFNPF